MNNLALIPELRFPEFKYDGTWIANQIADLGHFLGGGTPDRSKPEYWAGNIPWISSSDINEDDIHTISFTRFINDLSVKESAVKIIPIGSVLFVSRVGVGKLAINKVELCTSQDFTSFVPNKEVLNYFVGYFFSSNKNFLESLNQGTSIKGFSKSDFEKFQLPYPKNITEQQKIASFLRSIDELIAAETAYLTSLQNHKKGLMQKLFPQEGEKVPELRFKEFEGVEKWKETSLHKNCLVKGRIGYRGYTTEDIVEKGKGALVLGGKHIQNQLLCLTEPTYLSWEKYYESPEIMVEVGDIIFSQRGTLGDCAIVSKEIGPATINPSMVLLKNITCDARFLYYVLIGEKIQTEVYKNKALGAIPMISQKQIREFPFFIPSPREQQKIASCLSSLDTLITAQTEKIAQLKLHKKGLMQGLFPKIED